MTKDIVTCPKCETRNRIEAIARGRPHCARCWTPLPWLTNVGAEEFATIIETSMIPIVVDLWAPWCGPCRVVAPLLERLAHDRAGSLRVVKVNVDEAPEVSTGLGVQGIPTMLLFHRGVELARQVGAMPADQLTQWVDRSMAVA